MGPRVSFQGLQLEGWALETEAEHVCAGATAGSAGSKALCVDAAQVGTFSWWISAVAESGGVVLPGE